MIRGHGLTWWISLLFAWYFGIGSYNDYPTIRDKLNRMLPFQVAPEDYPTFWVLVLPLIGWVLVSLAHKAAMSRLRAARILFDEPRVVRGVNVYRNLKGMAILPSGVSVEYSQQEVAAVMDIAQIAVRNKPFSLEEGRAIPDAFCNVRVYSLAASNVVLDFDYPRWTENPKPGYEGSPSDHYPTEWNNRVLKPNGDSNNIDFILKARGECVAYGFRGISQLPRLSKEWRDPELKLEPGQYIVRLTVSGSGVSAPATKWLRLDVGETIDVESTKLRPKEPRWLPIRSLSASSRPANRAA